MRVVVDALAAEVAGIRTYVTHLIAAWSALDTDDELHLLVRHGTTLDVPAGVRLHHVRLRGPEALTRPWAQTRRLRTLVDLVDADAVLCTLPATSVRRVGPPTAVVVYDLRHELRPEQFSRGRRILRSIAYRRGYAIADGLITISERTLHDLHREHPETRSVPTRAIHLGADHVADWARPAPSSPRGEALAFAQHSNKNPALVIDAWGRARSRGLALPPLLVVGVQPGAERATLEDHVRSRRLQDQVRLVGPLDAPGFRAAFAGASVVVFPSDFEGFGLPVVEAMTCLVPVVIGPEPACVEVAGGHAVVMDGWSPDALAIAVERALQLSPARLAAAQVHARGFTWQQTALRTRAFLVELGKR